MITPNVSPEKNIFKDFMNTEHTYEDGFVMSSSAVTKFQYNCVHIIRFNSSSGLYIKEGDIIKPMSKGWWQRLDPGKVIKIIPNATGDLTVMILRVGYPVNRDKFTTIPGQKGVITILQDENMPKIRRYLTVVLLF